MAGKPRRLGFLEAEAGVFHPPAEPGAGGSRRRQVGDKEPRGEKRQGNMSDSFEGNTA